MNVDSIQEEINLTDDQQKAFNTLKRAVKKCQESNIFFYHVMETLGALNGNNVDKIVVTECDLTFDPTEHTEDNSLQALIYPTLEISESFADDTHWVILKEENN